MPFTCYPDSRGYRTRPTSLLCPACGSPIEARITPTTSALRKLYCTECEWYNPILKPERNPKP